MSESTNQVSPARGHHEDPREPSSDHPGHLYPGIATDHDLKPGRHSESEASIAVSDLVAAADSTDGHVVHGADGAAPAGAQQSDASGAAGNKWLTLVAVCLGTFMLLLDVTIVNVALPDIQDALHSSFSDLQWVVDAYALTLAALLL
ncbi:MFS transporter, partial [Jatrophihabitans endophyticus]|uniref:MFS transporter n=1 Tax=Jatrophihabitans endophyticus TaxID=1206085 RepID=UPI0019D89F8C|nr:hypothetical protein [Jatrophihabitans endophyticus]